jgi:hypothetical protein
MNNTNLQLTTHEWRRVKRLSSFLKRTVDDLASEGIMVVVQSWEDDLAIEPVTGQIIGENTGNPVGFNQAD